MALPPARLTIAFLQKILVLEDKDEDDSGPGDRMDSLNWVSFSVIQNQGWFYTMDLKVSLAMNIDKGTLHRIMYYVPFFAYL